MGGWSSALAADDFGGVTKEALAMGAGEGFCGVAGACGVGAEGLSLVGLDDTTVNLAAEARARGGFRVVLCTAASFRGEAVCCFRTLERGWFGCFEIKVGAVLREETCCGLL